MEKNKKQKAPKNTLIHEWVQEKGLLNNLPVYKVKKIQSSPVVRMSGPYDEEFPDSAFSHAFGRTTTTYPLDVESCRREGDPICDSYRIHTHPNATLFCICDGCGWGTHVKGAAAHARDAFTQFMSNKTSDMKTVKDCAQVFVTALAVAHQEILDGAAREKFNRIGTTTLVGGVIVQLDKAPTPYGIVLVNIGDCKAFMYSKRTRTVIDITAGNRGTDDASDPGGRIGPQVGQNDPDLRNLRFSFTGCEEGDLLLIMTDGVHDNFDPCTMGKKPTEIGLQEEKWEQVPAEVRDKAKQKYMEQCLTQLVTQNPNHITPMHLSKKFINSAFEATAKSREWMEQHPTQRLPSDNALFPGKPDHATCAIMVVGPYDPAVDQGYKGGETLNPEIFPF